MKFLFFLFILTLGLKVSAQEASSNTDLRSGRSIFYIKEFMERKKTIEYKLLTSVTGQFNFEVIEEGQLLSSKKVDTQSAHNLDETFVDQFISCKYLIKSKVESNCEKKYYLNLRGEDFFICKSDTDKIKKIEEFITKLKSDFL